jgi:hypothetical protein
MDELITEQTLRTDHFEPSLQQLRHVVLAAEFGSFRQAAEAASIKPSTLSRSVSQLEHLVGTSIFARSGNGVRATDFGQRFLRVAIGDVGHTLVVGPTGAGRDNSAWRR